MGKKSAIFVRTLDDLEKLGRIKYPADRSFRSARFLTAADGMGFSYNENKVAGGTDLSVWLKHHWEANYIVSGRGEVTDLTRGQNWPLEAGVVYVVGPNDRHRLHLTEDECHISIFCPPLTGEERFDEDGSYEASGPIEDTDRRMFVRTVDDMRRAGNERVTANGLVTTVDVLSEADGIGFGLSDMHLGAGVDTLLGGRGRWQSFHILAGTGELTDVATGEAWELGPGVSICAAPEDQHRVHAVTDMHLLGICALPPTGRS